MSTGFVPGVMEMVMMFALGGGMGLPLGIPPAPEDPVVSRAAPEECLFYVSWAGMAKPDPASPNQTEQLLAEKEVRDFLAQLEALIVDTARRASRDDPQAAAMVEPITTVVKAVLSSPTCAFVSKFDPAGGDRSLRGGALVSLGDRAAEIEQALAKIETATAEGEAKTPAEPAKWHRLPLGAKGLVAEWAVRGKYLILGLGEGEADKIVDRMRQDPHAWLSELRQQLVVPRPASMVYVNVAGILKVATPTAPPEARAMLEALGLTRVQSIASVTGLDDTGCISKTQITVDGDLKGLLSLFAGEPLGKDDLAVIPKDATLAAAVRLDLAKVYAELLDVMGRAEPRARDDLLGGVGQFEESMKIKLSQDVFESLGDTWRVYNSPSEGGLVITGLTAVINLRDHDRLVLANGKLVLGALGGAARRMIDQGQDGPGPLIGQFKFGEHTIFFQKPGLPLPFGAPIVPAWCITEKELVVALSPQNVKAYLSRAGGGGSLADVPAVAGLFAGEEAPMAVAYCDTPELFKLVYPIVQVYAVVFLGAMRGEESTVEVSLLPSAPAIGRHLRPTVVGVRRTKAGVVVETRQTLPAGGSGWALFGGSALSMWLRHGSLPTQQNTSINNLKQIMLALHNYHAARGHFPAAAAPQKPGQPPVSWRVLILPYVEEMTLYEQYHFDEPWDSENNKKVAAQMPAVYKAPGSKVAAQGKTNYLAVVGDEYALAADKGRSLAEIRDGTSNTIMVVEASDERAVPWTKPEDFTPDKTKPIAGLVGLRQGGFLAALTDGSVRRISAGIDAATLNAYFTRAGGEAVAGPDETGHSMVARPVPAGTAYPVGPLDEAPPAVPLESP